MSLRIKTKLLSLSPLWPHNGLPAGPKAGFSQAGALAGPTVWSSLPLNFCASFRSLRPPRHIPPSRASHHLTSTPFVCSLMASPHENANFTRTGIGFYSLLDPGQVIDAINTGWGNKWIIQRLCTEWNRLLPLLARKAWQVSHVTDTLAETNTDELCAIPVTLRRSTAPSQTEKQFSLAST